MSTNFEKRKRNLLLGVLGCALFMVGDWLLDMKGAGNVSIGFVESNWVNMSMWRFEVSILLGALGTPLYWCAAREMIAIFAERCGKSKMDSTMQRVFSVGAASAVLSWVFIHIMCCMLPVIFKCTYAVFPDTEAVTGVVNHLATYITVPFFAYFIAADGCLSVAWIYMMWNRKIDCSRWAVLCCPLFTLVLAHIVNYIPVLDQLTGAFESMGHLLMLGTVWLCENKVHRVRQ